MERLKGELTQEEITYKEWMAATKLGRSHPRSSKLKRIDKALKALDNNHSQANYRELRTAINDWIRSKGAYNWKNSKRNTKENGFIVERLRTWAFPGLPTPMTKEEVEAFEFMEESRRKVLRRVFEGKHVQLKIMSAIMNGASAAYKVKKAHKKFEESMAIASGHGTTTTRHAPILAKGIKAAGTGVSNLRTDAPGAVKNFLHGDLLDIENLDHLKLVKDMIPLDRIVTDFIPFVNIAVGAVTMLVKWGQVAKAAHSVHKTENSRNIIEMGDPQKAFDGIMKCLKRDRASKALQAAQSTAKFTAQIGGTCTDLGLLSGPAIAAVNSAATLAHQMFLFGREVKEVIKANKILSDPDNLDFKLFETYPLAGCYMIRCSDLSDIVHMSLMQFGNPGWMDDIEDMKKRYIDPMIKHCDRFIGNSLFEIPDMPKRNSPEMEKLKKQAQKAMKGMDLTGLSCEDFKN
ncbi:MAG: hypothetical protein AB1916_02330 [Thermodesulfobacteriota bacterium]